MTRLARSVAVLVAALAVAGCGTLFGRLSDRAVLAQASGGPLAMRYGQLILGNDRAFRSKLRMIEDAQTSIDAMYYIYADDFSSSVLSEALIAATRRGVRVRLLVDYHYNYANLDHFTMLERQAHGGRGALEVRFYNRPTRNIIMDAALLTLGCGSGSSGACSPAQIAAVLSRFEAERIDGRPAAELGVSNLSVANSGLFLSGLYGKRPDVMALAVLRGGTLDASALEGSPSGVPSVAGAYAAVQGLAEFQRLVGDVRLATVLSRNGDLQSSAYETFRPYLPAERRDLKTGALDWEYLTDFLHHKLLLVDATRIQLGGRNIEDSYHMRPNPMLDKYVFLDTDLFAALVDGGQQVQRAFEALWTFRTMVATTDEVRRHAPNDFVANLDAYREAAGACAGSPAGGQEDCLLREFGRRALGREAREARRQDAMRQHARAYFARYTYLGAPDDAPTFDVDPGALVAYIENLPFLGRRPKPPYERSYGSRNGEEARHGKHIHALMRSGLLHACQRAEPPQTAVLHNAYFLLPSNLVETFGQMVNGDVDCRHVTVTVLTNSAETTDLNVINLLARHSLKAFVDYSGKHRDPVRSARFAIFEYRKLGQADRISLHTKVAVLGGDFVVGSANADVRSYMMDSNNGFFIRGAPRFVDAYQRHLDNLMRDGTRTRNMTEYYAQTPRSQIVDEDRQTFRALLAMYGAERWLNRSAQEELERRFVRLLDLVYDLTMGTLKGGREGREKAAEFNRIFKPL